MSVLMVLGNIPCCMAAWATPTSQWTPAWESALARAAESIDSGAAKAKIEALAAVTQKAA